MSTIKTQTAVALLVGAILLSSAVTYTVMHFTVMRFSAVVDCPVPAQGAAPAPNIPTHDGERF
jgi:hypothetical protein